MLGRGLYILWIGEFVADEVSQHGAYRLVSSDAYLALVIDLFET